MQKRTQAVLSGCLFAAALTALPAEARLGVDEAVTAPSARAGHLPAGERGSAEVSFDEQSGGFVIESTDGDHKLVIGGRLQGRFDAIDWDNATDIDNEATFQMYRSRVYLLGQVMGDQNRFFIQFGADSPNLLFEGSGATYDVEFFDAWVKHTITDQFAFKFGQFKVPFSRQNLTSGGKLQFPDRAYATERLLGLDMRDLGIELSGGFEQGIVQYQVAVVNGDGKNLLNQDDTFAYFGRVSVNPTGDYGYDEGDMKDRQEIETTLGFAIGYQNDQTGDFDVKYTGLNIDGGLKMQGLSIQGEFYSIRVDPDPTDATTLKGFYLQGGHFVRPSKVELVARMSRVLLEGGDNDEAEYSFGLNLFTWGHRLKWQTAYSYYSQQWVPDSLGHHRFTSQGQIWF